MSGESNYSTELLRDEFDEREPIRAAVRSVVERHAPDGANVVELGSGLGFNLEPLQPKHMVTGVEGLREAAEAANARGVRTIHHDLARPVDLPSASFDVALCLDVLEHLSEPLYCVQEARRLLKPEGVFVVNVPNHFTLTNRLRILRGAGVDAPRFFPGSRDWNYPHVRFFRHESIAGLLEAGGFRIRDDWSHRFPAVPLLHRSAFARSFNARLARRAPDLFSGGFFLVASPAAGPLPRSA